MPNKPGNIRPGKNPAPGSKPAGIQPARKLPQNPYAGKTIPTVQRRSVFPFSNKSN